MNDANLTGKEGIKSTPTFSDQVYERLHRDIITCQLAPGEPFDENSMGRRLGVSKTPIRDALGRLRHDGLVQVIPRKGYIVTTLTFRDIQELHDVRQVLEVAVFSRALEQITDGEIAQLERYLDITWTTQDVESAYRYIQANKDFHMEIARASRNSHMIWYYENTLNHTQRMQYLDLKTGGGPLAWQRDHVQIIAALRNRDKRALAEAIDVSIRDAYNRLVSKQPGTPG